MCRLKHISIQALYDYKKLRNKRNMGADLISIQALYDYKEELEVNWTRVTLISIQALYDYKDTPIFHEQIRETYFNSSIVRL